MAKREISFTAAAIVALKDVTKDKSSIPMLNRVKVEDRDGVKIGIGTNLDLTVEARVNDDTVPGLYTIVGKELLPSRGDELKVEGFPLTGIGDKFKAKGSVYIPFATLTRLLPNISKENSRYTLNGALVRKTESGHIEVSSTDGHRLLVERIKETDDNIGGNTMQTGDYLIPRETLAILVRRLKGDGGALFEFYEDKPYDNVDTIHKHVRIATGDATYVSRTISGQFPNYAAIMPNTVEHQVSFNTAGLRAALEELTPFVKGLQTPSVKFEDKGDHFTMYAKNDGGYERTVRLNVQREVPVNVFDYTKILDSFSPSTNGFVVVLMPIRVGGQKYTTNDEGLKVPFYAEDTWGLSHTLLTDLAKSAGTDRFFMKWKDESSHFAFTPFDMSLAEMQHEEAKAA